MMTFTRVRAGSDGSISYAPARLVLPCAWHPERGVLLSRERSQRFSFAMFVTRLALVCALGLSANALALSCSIPDCSCLPSEFTAFAVLDSNGRFVFSDVRWSDGGVAVIDAGENIGNRDARAFVSSDPNQRFVVGGRSVFEDGGTRLGIEVSGFPLGDGGTTASCGLNVASTPAWRSALEQGTCTTIAPRPPCGEGPSRGCSTASGLSVVAMFAFVAARRRRH